MTDGVVCELGLRSYTGRSSGDTKQSPKVESWASITKFSSILNCLAWVAMAAAKKRNSPAAGTHCSPTVAGAAQALHKVILRRDSFTFRIGCPPGACKSSGLPLPSRERLNVKRQNKPQHPTVRQYGKHITVPHREAMETAALLQHPPASADWTTDGQQPVHEKPLQASLVPRWQTALLHIRP